MPVHQALPTKPPSLQGSPLGWDHIVLTGDYDWSSGAAQRSNVRLLNLCPAKIRASPSALGSALGAILRTNLPMTPIIAAPRGQRPV